MGINWLSTPSAVKANMRRRLEQVEQVIETNLLYLAERCVIIARSTNSYLDQTGNLRNSIGYVLAKNGRVIRSSFERTASGGELGLSTGENYAKRLVADYSSGYVLIVVAGMNYATAVESRGLDVLTSAEQFAQNELPRMLKELKITVALK